MISYSKFPAVQAFSPILGSVKPSTLTMMHASKPLMSVEVPVQLRAMHALLVGFSGPSQLTYTMFVHAAFVPTLGESLVGSASRHGSRVSTAVFIYLDVVVGVLWFIIIWCGKFCDRAVEVRPRSTSCSCTYAKGR